MCRSRVKPLIVRPVSTVRPFTLTDNLLGKGDVIPSWLLYFFLLVLYKPRINVFLKVTNTDDISK